MAEIKTGIFAKNVQKRLNRAQEKVLQKLGKADETKDEQFEQCVQNFKRQEACLNLMSIVWKTEGSRLQREMKAYLAAVKGMQQASMNLTESLHEVYEPDWYGKDDVMTIGKNCDALWEDFHQRLVDSSLITLDTYLAQFPDIKTRVSKRSRKLIDFDSARHHLETLQAATIKNDRKIAKAEEELKKAQKVFDDFNVDLQVELPSLWDSRVGFYVNTFKNVSHLESKFHREISVLCHKLYEVMNRLADQHSDKMFTIQGAPSDSGPLRYARTPSPPDESPPESPEASPNHMLAPSSSMRPRSPSQLRPPVPPPPKVTPTKELQQEQIISLFDSEFAPNTAAAATDAVPAPSAQPEKGIDSLLDLDFDPFKPDPSTPIGQTQSPISQTLPWDLWTAPAAETAQPGASDWAADFSGFAATSETAGAAAAAAGESAEGEAKAAEGEAWPPAEGWAQEAAAVQEAESAETAAAEAEAAEAETVGGETVEAEVSSWNPEQILLPHSGSAQFCLGNGGVESNRQGEELNPEGEELGSVVKGEGRDKSTPGIVFTDEHGQEIQDVTEGSELGLYPSQAGAFTDGARLSSDWSGSEYETADEWAESGGRNGGWASAEEEPEDVEGAVEGAAEQPNLEGIGEVEEPGGFADWGRGDWADPFQEQAEVESSQPAKESWFQAAEPTVPVAATVPTESKAADPFKAPNAFTNPQVDPFSQAVGADLVLDFVSDPFADPPGVAGGEWASDPFASDSNHMWPENWAPTVASDENWEFPGGSDGQSNGFAQWGAFPDPAPSEGGEASGNNGQWQEVSSNCGVFSTASQGEFTANWGDQVQHPSAAQSDGSSQGEHKAGIQEKSHPDSVPLATQSGTQPPWMSSIGAVLAHKDTENSDLSEDEATNRRYGKLYQEVDTEKEEVSNNALNGISQPDEGVAVVTTDSSQSVAEVASEAEADKEAPVEPESEPGETQEPPATAEASQPNSPEEKAVDTAPEAELAEPKASPEAESPEIIPPTEAEKQTNDDAALETATAGEAEAGSPTTEPPEKMPIPSVVIEPASSNEGDDDRDADITSPTVSTGNCVTPESQPETSEMPPGFMYKVETMHDFEAANSDELNLKKGDVVLVLPTANIEDQDAGWLTGIKESDWLQLGATAPKGLFPENFTQRVGPEMKTAVGLRPSV
ncbi:hypothetical protein GJAV_G00092200 [Gymnothorax javanicus]|nr:hypothetical protein GJAV_G00092200 [Gymnothorax javanicus]